MIFEIRYVLAAILRVAAVAASVGVGKKKIPAYLLILEEAIRAIPTTALVLQRLMEASHSHFFLNPPEVGKRRSQMCSVRTSFGYLPLFRKFSITNFGFGHICRSS